MAIQLDVTQSTEDIRHSSDSVALTANFTFVARDSKTGKSAPIKPILPEIKREKLLWQDAEKRSKMMKKKREESTGKEYSLEDIWRILMQRAFEMAFSTRYAFAGVASWFFEIDHVDFLRPVDAGNFLCLKCFVL
ncbi:hypothetical protein EUGRSUZ_H01854 [Eucalyptus grandis]|uniref:Uncharacterized protein n=2 Tax=Eucalyptus grandis TaxID=71139 RepID=A0ACC3LZV7_EUCGR|nr:hypothetical protein EUGRSUZ_H01854 [Eucalyptus grandis]